MNIEKEYFPSRGIGKSRITELIFDVAGIFLLGVLPLVIFLKFAGYPLLVPETLVMYLWTLAMACVGGLLMIPAGTPLRVAVFTALCVLIVDVQTTWITTWGVRLLLNIILWGMLGLLLRRHLSRIMVWMGGAMVLASLFVTSPTLLVEHGRPGPLPGDRQDLPFVLHIILDEQIGVEGIPAKFDPTGSVAGRLRESYLERSFEVYGRAYSRYASSIESIPNMLNGTSSDQAGKYFDGGFVKGMTLRENAWFDLLRSRGYRMHLVQAMAMRYGDPQEENWGSHDTVIDYNARDLPAFHSGNLPVSQRISVVLHSYVRLSFLLKTSGRVFAGLNGSRMAGALPWPEIPLGNTRTVLLSAYNAADSLGEDLAGAGPGQAWFVHLLAPHFPYGLKPDCSVEDVSLWVESMNDQVSPARNTPDSRALRYHRYFEQVLCIQTKMMEMFDQLERLGLWDEALVVVHGDHGSRISLQHGIPQNRDLLVASDHADLYSTFFAVKFPGGSARYDSRPLPLDRIFGRLLLEGKNPGDPDLEAHPNVYLQEGDVRLVPTPLLPFWN